MITAWQLQNFKSVAAKTNLQIGPLTIFAGANSVGKSTVIQSMLLTAQTLQSSVSKPIILNGHMVRLGSFSDIVSFGDLSRFIGVGFSLTVDTDAPGLSRLGGRYWYRTSSGSDVTPTTVDVRYAFSIRKGPDDAGDENLLQRQPSLDEATVTVRALNPESSPIEEMISVARSEASAVDRIRRLDLNQKALRGMERESLRYEVRDRPAQTSLRTLAELGGNKVAVGAYVHHFLPRAVVFKFDKIEATVHAVFTSLTQLNQYHFHLRENTDERITADAVRVLTEIFENLVMQQNQLTTNARRILRETSIRLNQSYELHAVPAMYSKLGPHDSSIIVQAIVARGSEIKQALRGRRKPVYELSVEPVGDFLTSGTEYVQNYFSKSVKYLGPLRDEPKPIYPISALSDPSDIGFRGEYTAAVLDAHKNTLVEFIAPESYRAEEGRVVMRRSLSEAVRAWLSYVGVGEGFSTLDSGKFGHSIKITLPNSELEHDLTQVGVGVSQVLPILVIALLAERGSTLIFEQPELHLHPRVQSRLADFFVSMTQLSKQCIVETHSEYIINRLRYQAVRDSGSSVAESVVIYFVEKSGAQSEYRRVRIDEWGGLDNWPRGFFDESDNVTDELLRKGLEKRRLTRPER